MPSGRDAASPQSALADESSSPQISRMTSANFFFISFSPNQRMLAILQRCASSVAALQAIDLAAFNRCYRLLLNDSKHRDKSGLPSLLVPQFRLLLTQTAAHMPFGTPSLHFQCSLHIFHQLFQKKSQDNLNASANF